MAEVKIFIDKAHGGLEDHVDMITILPQIGGSEKVRVAKDGTVINGETGIGKEIFRW